MPTYILKPFKYMVTMKLTTLKPILFSPDGKTFEDTKPEEFKNYVESLKSQKSLGKPIKLPRIKKIPLIHNVDANSSRCLSCGKKPRVVTSKCTGKAVQKITRQQEPTDANP